MDTCDKCGQTAELYHNEASGLAYCDSCETASFGAVEAARPESRLDAIEYALGRIHTLAREAGETDTRQHLLDLLGDINNYAALAKCTLRAYEAQQD